MRLQFPFFFFFTKIPIQLLPKSWEIADRASQDPRSQQKQSEFSWPIKVSIMLHEDFDCFICSSKEMDFDEFAAWTGGGQVLQPGYLL